MTEVELKKIIDNDGVAIVAPAGHGKTEMIVEIIKASSGKQLILTHTNAGVDALKKRLKKHSIPSTKYNVCTIAAFCIKYCVAFSNNAEFDVSVSAIDESTKYYAQLYPGMLKLLDKKWVKDILMATYDGVLVDEYQDCTLQQHNIILALKSILPVRVLGDPLQGIFGFAGKLVDWNNIGFNIIDVNTKPWRWVNSNEQLGEELSQIRNTLMPSLSGKKCTVNLSMYSDNIEYLNSLTFNVYNILDKVSKYKSVIYITKWPNEQINFCKNAPGLFQNDETQECKELFNFAKKFDEQEGISLANDIISFISNCATGVTTNLRSYINRLNSGSFDFSHIKKYPDLSEELINIIDNKNLCTIGLIITWFMRTKDFKFYRKELAEEMIRSLDYAVANNTSVFEAANHIRKDLNLQKRYNGFKFLSSRTLLSKGLEFDCVIIDMRTPLLAKDFYVAATRAMKKIYVISNSEIITLNP